MPEITPKRLREHAAKAALDNQIGSWESSARTLLDRAADQIDALAAMQAAEIDDALDEGYKRGVMSAMEALQGYYPIAGVNAAALTANTNHCIAKIRALLVTPLAGKAGKDA